MSNNFLGGIWRRGPGQWRQHEPPGPEAVNEDWGWIGTHTELFIRGAPSSCRLFTWDGLALLIRGYARLAGTTAPLDLERVAEEVRCRYLEQAELAVDDLEGSFTLALLDGQAGQALLYRNLVGAGFTYYHATPEGLLFGGNLTELIEAATASPAPNQEALPGFFLFRCVPGRETLFRDFHRLLPGEQVTWDQRGLRRTQRHTFARLYSTPIPLSRAIEHVDGTLIEVLRDCAAFRPGAANLLSGGVDSSVIQAVWNQAVIAGQTMPSSYSASVDHPHTWQDTDYAITASQALGTQHMLVPADGPYAHYLIDALAATGEPLNHVQSAYFGHLARGMKADGVSAGLCGEGADSLFGLGLGNQIQNARTLRRLLPAGPLRRLAAGFAGLVGWSRLAYTCRLADRVSAFDDLEHPVNRVAVFSDPEAVAACFGESATAAALAERRRLLDVLEVPAEPMDRLHAMGFLGEAMDSAGLWATLFQRGGCDLLCPFLDSRMLRLAFNLAPEARYPYRRPKALLKNVLARRAPGELARREKLGFGQPIFEWLSAGGQLRSGAERLGRHPFVQPGTMQRLLQRPTWFLYSLLCYDVWHRLFIERTLPRPGGVTPSHRDESANLSVV